MIWKYSFLYVIFLNIYNAENVRSTIKKFPDGFELGISTSAYQIEGAWNKDGKTESIWDRLTHMWESPVIDKSNGDVAANSYYLYKRDVEMMRELGVDFYRFSISWTRILPTGFPDQINYAGAAYYNNLIDEMLKYNIQPMVTLFHWDLPQKLQDLGGWTNPHIVEWYSDYARVAFQLFGDRVKSWITINEPHMVCYEGYASGNMAPGLKYSGVADYMCAKNLLLAHASAYHIYDQEFRSSQDGHVFISLSSQWYESENPGEYDDAAEDTMQFEMGQYAHPIFSKTGDWPPVMKKRIAAKSAEQGFLKSRLPEFSPEEIDFIRGTSDYFGLNHYTSYFVYRNDSNTDDFETPSFEDDLGTTKYQSKKWYLSDEGNYVASAPWGFYKLLVKIKEDYNNVRIRVTENGFVTNPRLDDDPRVAYFYGYLEALLVAIEAGVDVKSYSNWSLMDSFEWHQGYTIRFGLYEVDFQDENRPRIPRNSAFMYKQILRTRTLDVSFKPNASFPMTIDEGN